MTARGFDVYDQMVTVAATPQPTPTPTPAAQAAAMPKAVVSLASVRLLRLGVYIAAWSVLSFLGALVVTLTPLGAMNMDITQPFLASVAVAAMLTVLGVVRR